MKKKFTLYKAGIISLICAAICMALPVNAQFSQEMKRRINPALNEFNFKLDCYEDSDGMGYTRSITVTDTKTGQVLQTLKTADYNDGDDAQTSSLDAIDLIVEDLNFDNYADIRLNSSVTAGANHTELCWLWNTQKKQFEFNATLSEICNLEVRPDDQTIFSLINSGAAYYIQQTYKYIDGKPTLVRNVDQIYSDDSTYEEIISELKNGELVETSREMKKVQSNLLDDMSSKDWRALNIFFSNFSEAGVSSFSQYVYGDITLINFGVRHNLKNNINRFKEDDYDMYIEPQYVKAAVKKYFGIDNFVAQSGLHYFVHYQDGKYYWTDILEGSPTFTGTQVVELYDNEDGTFSALLENFSDNTAYANNPPDNYSTHFYNPQHEWKEWVGGYCESNGFAYARIAKHTYEGKEVYKLLDLYPTDTLDSAREIMDNYAETANMAKLSKEVLKLLRAGNYTDLAGKVHPAKGLRIVPFASDYENKSAVRFSPDELKKAAGSTQTYLWGTYEDSGKKINMSLKDYAAKFLADADYGKAPFVEFYNHGGYNECNFEIEAGSTAIYFLFPNSNEEASDWKSLSLVFSPYNNKWYLSALVHNQ